MYGRGPGLFYERSTGLTTYHPPVVVVPPATRTSKVRYAK